MSKIENSWRDINRCMIDMADAFTCVIPIIQKFNSEMQQFTDSIAPPVDAAIDGESVKARILPSGSEIGASGHV